MTQQMGRCAGKSTMFKILSGVIQDYEGSCTVDGKAVSVIDSERISYLPEVRRLDGRAQVLEHLTGECGIAVVKAWCAEDNIGSKRAMEKCGMSFAGAEEGALEIGGETFTRLDYEYRAAAEEAGKAAAESAADVSP